jgi:hypothetical protein
MKMKNENKILNLNLKFCDELELQKNFFFFQDPIQFLSDYLIKNKKPPEEAFLKADN